MRPQFYDLLTQQALEDALADICNEVGFRTEKPKSFVVYTGYEGMRMLDLTMMFSVAGIQGWFDYKYYWGTTRSRNRSKDILYKKDRKLGFIYISLVEKAGMFKLKFYSKNQNLKLYKGTELVMITKDLKEVNEYIKRTSTI